MRKNIVIALMLLIATSSMTYAYIKADEAEKAHLANMALKESALELQNEVVQLKNSAEMSAAKAIKYRQIALEALVQCESK